MNKRTCYVPGCQRKAVYVFRKFPVCKAHARRLLNG